MGPQEVLAIMNIVMAGVFGAVIGSFTNVCIYRIPEHRTIVKGHSMCMTCGHELGALDLVPIFSWLFLGGKCRYCKTPISSRYIKIESLTALMYILMAATHLNMFFDPMAPTANILPFLKICVMFIMINIVIVEMMIMKDTGSSMFVLSAALGIDLLVQFLIDVACVFLPQYASSVTATSASAFIGGLLVQVLVGAAIGLVAVVLAVLFTSKPSDLSKYFSSEKTRAFRTSDLFAIVLCAAIGIIPAIVCALVYLIARIAIGNKKSVRLLGAFVAAGAAVGYFGYAAYQLLG
ncbi:MAG: prepilin peptidase [Clostridiales bacterium]|nr:prepilin peptidase [Clostridiales bacterium]